MKFLKVVGIGIVVVLGVLFVTAWLIKPEWEVVRSITIEARTERVFPYINSVRQWPQWTAWNQQAYPDMRVSHEGPAAGVGATQRWQDGGMQGVITITRSVANRSMGYDLSMDNGKHRMQGEFQLESTPQGAKVTWRVSGDAGANLLERLMMLAFKPMIGADLETGLNNLKQKLEAEASRFALLACSELSKRQSIY